MRRVLLFLVVAGALALSAAAAATIVPQKGIAGVLIGMTEPQVRAKLGHPKSVKNGKNEFGPYRTLTYARVRVSFQGLTTVTQVDTTSSKEKTLSGVGVGSTKADVKAKVKGIVCEPGHCHVGQFSPGARVTDFFIGANGRVTRVVVGIVID